MAETARDELLDENLSEDLGGLTIELPFADYDPVARTSR